MQPISYLLRTAAACAGLALAGCAAPGGVRQGSSQPPLLSILRIDVASDLAAPLDGTADVLMRLQADGWFRFSAFSSGPVTEACRDTYRGAEPACRDAMRSHAGTPGAGKVPGVVVVFTPARNQLAYVDCVSVGRYRLSAGQSLLADYRLALQESAAAEDERAKIAACILSASRETAGE